MFSVIFEVFPKAERFDDYLGHAKHLKPILETIDGFVDNERFKSRRRDGWLLSHSTWRDEKSVVRWRTQEAHHHVQEQGRGGIFRDYHLRVGDVTADTDAPPKAPVHEMRFDATEVGAAATVTLTEVTMEAQATPDSVKALLPAHLGLEVTGDAVADHDLFESLTTPGKLALLVSWKRPEAARAWAPGRFDAVEALRHRVVRIVRDYGMFDRREAPQYYPAVPPAGTA
jgi:heme-degrading monooxygenase HmoA